MLLASRSLQHYSTDRGTATGSQIKRKKIKQTCWLHIPATTSRLVRRRKLLCLLSHPHSQIQALAVTHRLAWIRMASCTPSRGQPFLLHQPACNRQVCIVSCKPHRELDYWLVQLVKAGTSYLQSDIISKPYHWKFFTLVCAKQSEQSLPVPGPWCPHCNLPCTDHSPP